MTIHLRTLLKTFLRLLFLGITCCSLASVAYARDSVSDYSVKEALTLEVAKTKLGNSVSFYFGSQPHGKVVKIFGEFKTNKKTNAFNKSDLQACQWVFLSAMISLRDRALKEGGNAVINIRSNYKGSLTSSSSKFRCGAGNLIAGVALIGTVVSL